MSSTGVLILITGKMTEEGLAHLKKGKRFNVQYFPGLAGEELNKQLAEANALIVRTETPITRDLLQYAKKLEVICRSGIGVDHIDLEACSEKQIVVMNTPGANRVAAAEFTLGLILSLARMIPQANDRLHNKKWDREEFTGLDIQQKTLGIIGLGNIGQRVASRARALSMRVLAHDPYITSTVASRLDVQLLPRNELLEQSDFVTLHVPLTSETAKMAGSAFFGQMKKGSYFINTSRGAVVEEGPLSLALMNGPLAGAAIDVFETEPLSPQSPLLNLRNVILTPHLAGQTRESQKYMSLDAATQIRDFFEEGTVINAVSKI